MFIPLIVAIVFIKFIKDQFEFSAIRWISYWFIPIFCLYQFARTFTWSPLNVLLTVGLVLVAYLVGHYQTAHTQVRLEETGSQYFRDANGQEVPIYRKVVTAQGGRHYLYGWLIILVLQIVIEGTYLHEVLTVDHVFEATYKEVLADVLIFYRFSGGRHSSWILWGLTAFSSLSYTLLLAHKSPLANRVLFGKKKYQHVAENEDRNAQ